MFPALVYREVPCAPSPASFFGWFAARPGAFLLDSGAAEGVPPSQARWSFFGSDPFLSLSSRARAVRIEGPCSRREQGDPLRSLSELMSELGFAAADGSSEAAGDGDPPFTSGAVGYFGYDLKHHIERLPEPAASPDTDDMHLGFYSTVGAYDHQENRLWLLSRGLGDGGGKLAAHRALDDLARRVESALEAGRSRISDAGADDSAATGLPDRRGGAGTASWRGSFTPEAFRDAVLRLKDCIAAGEIYQANLSQRFEMESSPAESDGDSWRLYRALRRSCPAPYAGFLRCGRLEILSSSPEMFLRRRGERIETRPIKGTRPRGANPEEDLHLRTELRESAKDRAELMMIVDLERNDLGRICRAGSVEVTELVRMESYANVHHLVATVQGRLGPRIGIAEILRATFPGGSITGAPKIRAMELLDSIEPTRRGPYTGAAGYLDVSGNFDLHVAIRTAYRQGPKLWFQVGAGIVADSDPCSEHEETLAKGRVLSGLLRAGRAAEPRSSARPA